LTSAVNKRTRYLYASRLEKWVYPSLAQTALQCMQKSASVRVWVLSVRMCVCINPLMPTVAIWVLL